MSRRFRRRAGGPPNVFTSQDAKVWRKLVREARFYAKTPTAGGGDFLIAASRAASACYPWPVLRGDADKGPFLELLALGRAWPSQTVDARREQAPRVLALCQVMEAVMGDPPKPQAAPPPPRVRADIDG
jgi:hypothetical protein